jgi:purine nucleosidase
MDVRTPYREERLIISDQEKVTLQRWMAEDAARPARATHRGGARRRRKLVIDTDIGTDIDDALALLMLLKFPEEDFELLGLTTVYGYSHLRAAVAERIVRAFEGDRGVKISLPILAGESTPLGTHREVWHTGTEGLGVLSEREISELKGRADFDVSNGLSPSPITRGSSRGHEAASWIAEQMMSNPGEVTLVGLGSLTNIAVALELEPAMASRVGRLVYMGMGNRFWKPQVSEEDFPFRPREEPVCPGHGVAWFHYPNHNLCSDTLAAARVFASGMKIDVVNDTVTNQLWFGEPLSSRHEEVEEARAACLALREPPSSSASAVVGRLLDVWLRYRSMIFGLPVRGTCPHDALTVADAVYPERFVEFTEPGHLMIHEWAAFPTFVCGEGGPHRIGRAVSARPFLELMGTTLMPCAGAAR